MNNPEPKPISTVQIRKLHALARKAGMDNDTLHAMVKNLTASESIKTLTSYQGKVVIDRIKLMSGEREKATPPNRPTPAQTGKVYALARELGWMDDPKRLRGFLEKRYQVSHVSFLDDKKTRNCIEALKAIKAGGRGERRCVDGVDG